MKTKTVNAKKPTPPRKHLEEIMEQHIRPLLRDHGGDIAVREVNGKDVKVALLGACRKCPAAQITIEQTVQRILSEVLGDEIGNIILINETDSDLLDFAKQILRGNKT